MTDDELFALFCYLFMDYIDGGPEIGSWLDEIESQKPGLDAAA